jgi:hypothetical protein
MANSTSVDKAVDDLLICTICLETFKVPKYLPYLHMFCETCIHTYITSSVKWDKSTGLKCPICRQLVSFEEKGGKPEAWSKQLPGNRFVLSLLNRNAIIKSEKLCSSCEWRRTDQITKHIWKKTSEDHNMRSRSVMHIWLTFWHNMVDLGNMVIQKRVFSRC